MAKFIGFRNFLQLYLILPLPTCTFANLDTYSSEIPPTEGLVYKSSPTPEETEPIYDKSKPPPDTRQTLAVEIMSVHFDESQLICNITFMAVHKWKDTRLPEALEYLGIPETWKSYYNIGRGISQVISNHTGKIWAPPLSFGSPYVSQDNMRLSEIKDAHAVVKMYPKKTAGVVSISANWYAVSKSENDFRDFPRDSHFCRFWFVSAGDLPLNTSSTDFNYRADSKQNPVFSRRKVVTKNIREYGIDIYVLFTRKIGYHLIQTFIPSALLTGISLMSLFLPVEVAEARVALCVGILLALTVFANEARKAGPVVSYITAMDIWLLGCISIETLTLIENIIILKIITRRVIPRASPVMSAIAKVVRSTPGYSWRQSLKTQVTLPRENEELEQTNVRMRIHLASTIDHICIIISMGLVLALNIAYWLTLHFHENDMVKVLNFEVNMEDVQ